MFDNVEIQVKAGNGGDGAVSFRREAHAPYGGPNGGDGGNGGNVILKADPSTTSLRMFNQHGVYRAQNGQAGGGKRKHGSTAEDLVLNVPVGTVVIEKGSDDEGKLIADLREPEQCMAIARGGKGGWGNVHYASPTNQVPRLAQKGSPGEERTITLEMRLIADVGIIGQPNAGKSTLITAASAARPEIAAYPFTTKQPVLGVVEVGQETFVMAEIPGLIAGAHLGKGLGHDFLRHIMRTTVLIHLVDGSTKSPLQDMERVNLELALFDPVLAAKPQIVTINKVDLPEVQAHINELKAEFAVAGADVCLISAATGKGVPELMARAFNLLKETRAKEEKEKPPAVVFRPRPRRRLVEIHQEDDVFIIHCTELERIAARVDMSDTTVRQQVRAQMDRLGISKALEKAGVKPGDRLRSGDVEWNW